MLRGQVAARWWNSPAWADSCGELPRATTQGLPSAAMGKLQPLHRLVPDPAAERGRERALDEVKRPREAAANARAS